MTRDNHPEPLIGTKITLPTQARGLIRRERLFQVLEQIVEHRLCLIKAPAGFGKTTLAVGWAEQLREAGHRIGWLSLDPDDDEPTRFLFYLAGAIERACAGPGRTTRSLIEIRSLVASTTLVSTLINELLDVDEELTLFLDDYHWLQNPAIHAALVLLLQHTPANIHFVIATRSEPPLPLARLRVNNQLLEVDASELRFDMGETQRFFEQSITEPLGYAEIRSLLATTEGWAAGLRIASLSLRSQIDPIAFVRAFSSAHRSVNVYLSDLLSRLPAGLITFMLRTSILQRLSAPVCEVVSGARDSQAMLETIEQQQLFLESLDPMGTWFRYHYLFAEYLRDRLKRELGSEISSLHRRASRWYAEQARWAEAVRHGLAAGDIDQAVAWIEHCAMGLVKEGDLLTLLSWQQTLPQDLLRKRLPLRLAIAWCIAIAMRHDETSRLIDQIEQDLDSRRSEDTEDLRWQCQLIRAVIALGMDDSVSALQLAETCRHTQPAGHDPWFFNAIGNVERFALYHQGDFEGFYGIPWVPYRGDENVRNLSTSIYRCCLHGLVEAQQARFEIMAHHCREALELAARQPALAALPATLMAQLHFECNRLDESESLLVEHMDVIKAIGFLDLVMMAFLTLARIAYARGNIERAYHLLEQTESIGYERSWPRLVAAALVERLRLYIAEGRLMEGSACLPRLRQLAREHPAPQPCAWRKIHNLAALGEAYLALAHQRSGEAVSVLQPLCEEARASGNSLLFIRAGTLLAIALLSVGRNDEAIDVFRRVIATAEPSRFCRTILEQGPEVGVLLRQLKGLDVRRSGSDTSIAYIDELLEACYRIYPEQGETRKDASALLEPLSEREVGIITLLARGRSNKEIARSLGIAPETVKWHLKNIYLKLAVEKRAQAVARAHSLGLINLQWSG